MKKILMFLMFGIMSIVAFGQTEYQDVVYLKNGGIIRGVIIEQVPDQIVKIETIDRSVFVYQMNDIEKFTKEPIQGLKCLKALENGLKSGYRFLGDLGYQVGVGDYNLDRLSLNIVNGYQFNPYIYAGVGVGLRYYTDDKKAVIPVFLNFRTTFIGSKVSPYLELAGGFSYNATDDFERVGVYLHPSIGAQFSLTDQSKMYVGVGYELQKKEVYLYDYYYGYKEWVSVGALSLKVGFSL
ncbi:MAG: hypothetical protein LWX70_11170 [Sphingobacteriia bacterium]|nr:hypothetical protein [Sphingobacteriia bacterium]